MTLGLLAVIIAGAGLVPLTVLAATINGTSGNDTLEGTDSPDTIYGRGGNDKIYGFKGNDNLYGGRGDDQIWGGSHNDNIYAWYGNNAVSGGEGNDRIWATGELGPGENDYNTLRGYGGNDVFIVRDAGATIYGGNGDDSAESIADAGFGGFIFYGEDGDDTVKAGDNAAQMHGGDGEDRLVANGEANHRLWGDADNDYLEIDTDVGSTARGGSGDDYLLSTFDGSLYGDAGDDILESSGSLAANRMFGGAGADEFRCNGDLDLVEDFDESEGDTIVGDCESIN